MANTVTVWVRLASNDALAQSLLAPQPTTAIPLIMRLHPSPKNETMEEFQFPYNPTSIQYGQLADEVAQVPRPGTTPIVAFKSHRLMTLDITFTLARPGDGLVESVEHELVRLRTFASSPNRLVSLLDFDLLTNQPRQYPNMSREASVDGLFFSIVEFSFESTRRNRNNQITQANCQLSLIENRNPYMNITYIPILKVPPIPKECKDPVFKKNNPTKCPDPTKTITRFLPSDIENMIINGRGFTVRSQEGTKAIIAWMRLHPKEVAKYGASIKAYEKLL